MGHQPHNKCCNCQGNHRADSHECVFWRRRRDANFLKTEKGKAAVPARARKQHDKRTITQARREVKRMAGGEGTSTAGAAAFPTSGGRFQVLDEEAPELETSDQEMRATKSPVDRNEDTMST